MKQLEEENRQLGAYRVMGSCCTSHRYRSHRRDDRTLRLQIVGIAETRVRYGYRRVIHSWLNQFSGEAP